MTDQHKPISEEELKEMETKTSKCAEGSDCFICAPQRRLIAEVRRLRCNLMMAGERAYGEVMLIYRDAVRAKQVMDAVIDPCPCPNPLCDALGPHARCFKDGRWLDDGSEM